MDLAGFQARPSLRPQQVYQVQGAVKNPAVKELQLAGTDYPEWVAARYLKLPSSITLRTRELAQEITQGLENPYDKVVAVTTYLRNHIQYQATIPSVPRNQEPIDWLLFDLKKGFCNYYATAEVVLLRTLGIPARWVIGYAQGEILQEGVYLAREADGHAWPEVYFPGIGWVEFEPTASQPEISRPSGEQALIADESTPLEEESMAELRSEQFDALKKQREDFLSSNVANYPRPWQIIIYWGLATSLFILLLVLAWRLLGRLNLPPLPILLERWMVRVGVPPPKVIHDWARRAGLVPIARAYNEINHALARLGDPPRINLTPAERADHLTSLLPPTEKPAKILVQEYQASLFSQSPADLVLARAAGSEIRMLSYHELLQRLLKRLQRPQRHR